MSAIVLPFPGADPSRSHPLPSIPNPQVVGSSEPLPSLPNQSLYDAPESGPSTSRPSLASPSCMSSSTHLPLSSVLQEPRILVTFLRYVRWRDFQSLFLTCTTCSSVLQHPKLRDAVLSAFVPGYRYCLRHADVDIPRNIDVQLSDLSHFKISQQLPLHHYPTHALASLSASCKVAVLEEEIQRYVMLCQAHSRMVLLLQALIHSSVSPVPVEQDDPSSRYRNVAQQGGRELVFPAPLSFFSNDGDSKKHVPNLPTTGAIRFLSLPSASRRVPRSLETDAPRRSLSRLSVLRRNKVPPPPPSAETFGLKLYSVSRRGRRRTPTITTPTSENGEILFRRPKRKFASAATDSSNSSTDNSQGSLLPQHPSPTRTAEFSPIPPVVHAPHDIRAATSRLRAPILRVYFPCSEVDHRSITACEVQLDEAGLWQHLSVGDVVCNLGYLPPAADGENNDLSSDGPLRRESWMIFNGTGLLPYTPAAVLPLSGPLSLPSPLYYAHITSPPVNPRFVAALPHEEPEFSLVPLPATVRSPHSPNGFARIRKYQWLARLGPHVRHGLGEGWYCEWILEGEGTKEGRQSLLDALRGNARARREWELVMEKCTTTRIWLRLMSTMPPTS
ncbi:hypothetical protein BJV74DRAFT_882370 [Russula compacta]|nr:hypothetical protein BJV74DRAFT_882370 [Russula compacta]